MSSTNVIVQSTYGPIIVNVNDRQISQSIFQKNYWSLPHIKLIKELLDIQIKKHNSIIYYDVGANLGTHTLPFSKIYNDKILIRSFEAQRRIYYMLCGTMAINNITNVFCYNKAVSEINDHSIEFNLPDYSVMNNFGGVSLEKTSSLEEKLIITEQKEKVKTINIDSFNEKVDFIKIDVEGMENKVLKGAVNTITNHKPYVFLELTKSDTDFIKKFFQDKNYNCFQFRNDAVFCPISDKVNIKAEGVEKIF